MPPPWNRRLPHQQPKPKPSEIIAGMRALAATPEAAARVAGMGARWGVTQEKPVDEAASKRSRENAAAGRRYESLSAALLRREGWQVTRSQDSQGAADFVAVGPEGTRLVQVKSVSAFTPSCANEAVRDFLGLGTFRVVAYGPGIVREVVVWMRGRTDAPIARVFITPDDAITATGEAWYPVVNSARAMVRVWRERGGVMSQPEGP